MKSAIGSSPKCGRLHPAGFGSFPANFGSYLAVDIAAREHRLVALKGPGTGKPGRE
jgi:hypothetical protein